MLLLPVAKVVVRLGHAAHVNELDAPTALE